jgi:hypothetical protein
MLLSGRRIAEIVHKDLTAEAYAVRA